MKTKEAHSYTYECEGCGALFINEDQTKAQKEADRCNSQVGAKHAFKVGDLVSVFVGCGRVNAEDMYIVASILELKREKKTHKPQYLVKGHSYLWENRRLTVYAESAYKIVNGVEPQSTFVGSGFFNLTTVE